MERKKELNEKKGWGERKRERKKGSFERRKGKKRRKRKMKKKDDKWKIVDSLSSLTITTRETPSL